MLLVFERDSSGNFERTYRRKRRGGADIASQSFRSIIGVSTAHVSVWRNLERERELYIEWTESTRDVSLLSSTYGLVKAPSLACRPFSIGLLSAPHCGRFGGRGQSSSCFWVCVPLYMRTILWAQGMLLSRHQNIVLEEKPMFRKKDRKGFFVDLDLCAIPDTTGIRYTGTRSMQRMRLRWIHRVAGSSRSKVHIQRRLRRGNRSKSWLHSQNSSYN